MIFKIPKGILPVYIQLYLKKIKFWNNYKVIYYIIKLYILNNYKISPLNNISKTHVGSAYNYGKRIKIKI